MSANSLANTEPPPAADRAAACPECGCDLRPADSREHLLRQHGYVDLAGLVLPPAAALICLWDRVFATGDLQAHQQICQLLGAEAAAQTSPSAYSLALETELLRRAGPLSTAKPTEFLRLAHCLRQNAGAHRHFWHLLTSTDPRVREWGRELVFPELSAMPAWTQATAQEVQQLLDKLCPREEVWDKIRIGQRLPQYGLPTAAVAECLARLRGERPSACPECAAVLPQEHLADHLQRVHHREAPREVGQPGAAALPALFTAVCSGKPEAWKTLQACAAEEQGANAEAFLVAGVMQALQAVDRPGQGNALSAAAQVIAGSGNAVPLTLRFAQSTEPLAQQLALALAPLLPLPLRTELVTALQPLLVRKRAPQELQIAAAAALLRSAGKAGTVAEQTLRMLVLRGGKARSVERLNQLEEQVGPTPLLSARRAQLESRIRMRCPRCSVQLRRPQMAEHLWSEHALILDGRRVREPWRLVDDWIAEYRQQGNAQLLLRCRALGQHLDPEHGLQRVYRRFLAAGIADAEARHSLWTAARHHHASLCPRCYALVPLPEESMPRPLNQSHGRLSLAGYCVEVKESGFVPRLSIETPTGLLFRGREAERWLTPQGASFLLAGPPVLAAFVYALVHLQANRPLWPVLLFLLAALVLYLLAALIWWLLPRPIDRAIDVAWTRLVPGFGSNGFPIEEATFLAGLAMTSANHGRAEVRAEQLQRMLHLLERAVAAGTLPLAHLAAVERLAVVDAVAAGRDPVALVVEQISPCFEGRLPLVFAQWLLAEWEGSWWTAGNLARLRVLLCDRAFAAGWEMADLRTAGSTAPALADVLRTTDADGLAQLRLLWSLRPRRPWAPWSEAVTVFELAEEAAAGRAWLERYPDLLLLDQAGPLVLLCGRGLIFRDTLFTEPPRLLEIHVRRDFEGVEYELIMGGHVFRFVSDPDDWIGRLKRWFGYHFSEFLPQVAEVHTWQAPPSSKSAPLQEASACPECQQLLLPRAGELGIPADKSQGTATPPRAPMAVRE